MDSRVIKVVDYDPKWVTLFESEKQALESHLCRENTLAIHHIGSTSVPGLCAKPVIDILLEVADLDMLDQDNPAMELLGSRIRGEYGIPGRRFFLKREIERTHHIHAFVAGTDGIKRHLAFRNYLKAFESVMRAYGELKKEGAALCCNDIDFYIHHKDAFIKHYEQEAICWMYGCSES